MRNDLRRAIRRVTMVVLFCLRITSSSAETLPQFFGLYLRAGEQLFELHADPVDGGGLASVTPTSVQLSTPALILYHDQHSPHDLQLAQLHYVFDGAQTGTWRPHAAIPLKIAPIEGKPAMYLFVPGKPLPEGVYAAHFGSLTDALADSRAYSFVVGDPKMLIDLTVHRAKAVAYLEHEATWNQAVTEYHQALQITPEDAELQEQLAQLYYRKRDDPAAISAFQRLLTLAPDAPEARKILFELYLRAGEQAGQQREYATALDYLTSALALAEQIAPELIGLIAERQTNIHDLQGNFEQALASAHIAAAQNAPGAKPYLLLAYHAAQQKQPSQALDFLHKAAQRGMPSTAAGVLRVDTGYGELLLPLADIASVSATHVTTKHQDRFVGTVVFEIDH